jgi:lysozyme
MTAVLRDGALWHVDAEVALEVAAHEALIRQTYRDSVGVLTWCVGMTNATGHTVERYIGKPQTLQHCMNIYAWALENYADGVREAFKGLKITKGQFAAALSFHWNTGAIKRATWVQHFRAGNDAAARKAIMNWKTPPEIEDRRKKERALFFDGKWSNTGTMLEYTRVTAAMNPDWGSGKRINVAAELAKAFAGTIKPPVLDVAPKPDNKPIAPTLTPKPEPINVAPAPDPVPGNPVPDGQGGGQTLASLIAALFRAIFRRT